MINRIAVCVLVFGPLIAVAAEAQGELPEVLVGPGSDYKSAVEITAQEELEHRIGPHEVALTPTSFFEEAERVRFDVVVNPSGSVILAAMEGFPPRTREGMLKMRAYLDARQVPAS